MGKTISHLSRLLKLSALIVPTVILFQNCSPFEVMSPEMMQSLSSSGSEPLAGSFNINGGSAYSKSNQVTLKISAELGKEIQISEGDQCLQESLWVENSGMISYELDPSSTLQSLSLRGRSGSSLSTCLTQKISVDLEAPAVQLKPGLPEQIQAPQVVIEFTTTDNFLGVQKSECQLDNGAWEECSSPKTFLGFSSGAHVVRVKATDRAGHVSEIKEHAFTLSLVSTPTPTPTPTATPVMTPPVSGTPWPATIKVMPLGDSITEGGAIGGYRYYLLPRLKSAGYSIDFVGDYSNGHSTLADKNHQGVRGYRIDQVANGWQNYIDKHKPDIVLLGAGGNDISSNYQLDTAPQRLLTLAKNIQMRSPKTWVIVQTRPMRTDSLNAKVITFNAAVTKIINEESKTNPKIFLQDNYPLLQAGDIYSDKVHPTYAGYEKLAGGWFTALKKILPAK